LDFNLAAALTATELNGYEAFSGCLRSSYCSSYVLEVWFNGFYSFGSSRLPSKLGSLKNVGMYYASREKKSDQRDDYFYLLDCKFTGLDFFITFLLCLFKLEFF